MASWTQCRASALTSFVHRGSAFVVLWWTWAVELSQRGRQSCPQLSLQHEGLDAGGNLNTNTRLFYRGRSDGWVWKAQVAWGQSSNSSRNDEWWFKRKTSCLEWRVAGWSIGLVWDHGRLLKRESKCDIYSPHVWLSCPGYWGLISNCEPFLHCLASVCAPFLVVT